MELCRYQGYSRTHANTSGARRQPRGSLCSTGAGRPYPARAYSTFTSLGFGVNPGMRPRLATGRPATTLRSMVMSMGRALEM